LDQQTAGLSFRRVDSCQLRPDGVDDALLSKSE
jgi:hypothetical protein